MREIEEDDNFPEPYEEGFLSDGRWGFYRDEWLHANVTESYEMRDGKLYRNDRLANQIANQPLHCDVRGYDDQDDGLGAARGFMIAAALEVLVIVACWAWWFILHC